MSLPMLPHLHVSTVRTETSVFFRPLLLPDVNWKPPICFFVCAWSKHWDIRLNEVPQCVVCQLTACLSQWKLLLYARKENRSTFFIRSRMFSSFKEFEGYLDLLTPYPLLPLVSTFKLSGRYSSQTTSTQLAFSIFDAMTHFWCTIKERFGITGW